MNSYGVQYSLKYLTEGFVHQDDYISNLRPSALSPPFFPPRRTNHINQHPDPKFETTDAAGCWLLAASHLPSLLAFPKPT